VTSVADTPSEEAYPAWSPDGRMLVFSSTRGNADGETDLYVATAEGSIVRRLTSAPGRDTYADWSADGRYIYFNSGRGRERGTDVYRMEMQGDDCRRTR
jgi:TolB protein